VCLDAIRLSHYSAVGIGPRSNPPSMA
jgi:hypothetical protein